MATIVIKSKSAKRLKALSEFARQMDFEVTLQDKKTEKNDSLKKDEKGLTVIKGDSAVDPSLAIGVFNGKNYSKQSLRERAWKKRK